ncbi:hypothetical protein Mapa_008201 [Marchantia paleacea]|nr:hypothetical protein Mapa_008201 [Marchantia paleacea]
MVLENGTTKRAHVLMVCVPFPGHCAPFTQLLYHLSRHENVKVTVMGHKDRNAEMAKLYDRGEFRNLELHFETVFGDPPPYPSDPKFPIRAATCADQMLVEFEPVKQRLVAEKDNVGAPTSIVCDMFLWFTKDAADEMGVPWYPFVSTSQWFGLCGYMGDKLSERNLHPHHSEVKDQKIDIPGLDFAYVYDIPHEVMEFPEFYANVTDRTLRATGILCNSAYELEGSAGTLLATKALVQQSGKKNLKGEEAQVIPVGPMAQIPGFGVQYNSRDQPHECLKWLNTHAEKSVLYIAFGSLGNIVPGVFYELALGLEASGVSFLWALKMSPAQKDELLPQGFLERVQSSGLGFIESGWAPQTQILTHPATGGFLSHCGWNSTMESLCAGVPMITWPLSADQPMNARFVVDVKKVGVTVLSGSADESVVGNEDISKAVKRLMVEEEGKQIKRNSLELKKLLASLVAEGGSTYKALRYFINDLVIV